MLKKYSVKIGKFIKKTMQLRGGGSALPGLIVEKIDPHFLRHALENVPYGVVLISGTNGKTTTTKIVTQLLRAEGLRVFTNPSGSNFTRGIVASLLSHVDEHGTLDADIAVLELDEAHAVHFVREVAPTYCLVLNVLRDQLDRFGEIDHTAKLLQSVVEKTTKGVVLNRDDELVSAFAQVVEQPKKLSYFGVSEKLKDLFPSDAHMRNQQKDETVHTTQNVGSGDVILSAISKNKCTFTFGSSDEPPVKLKLDGIHNLQNAAAALALVAMIRNNTTTPATLLAELSKVQPAFGRGEAIDIDGQPLEIVLVKNPSGFRISLKTYEKRPAATLIAINDLYADGRDMSWLWDVDFGQFASTGVSFVSGIRAYDMALRLQYDNIEVGRIVPDVSEALRGFLSEQPGPKRIFCTYTAMLALRRELAKQYSVEPVE